MEKLLDLETLHEDELEEDKEDEKEKKMEEERFNRSCIGH